MIDIQPLQQIITRFIRKARHQWQLFAFATMAIYGITALFLWTSHPAPRPLPLKTINTLNNLAFGVAVLFAIAIFLQKRNLFSPQFSKAFFQNSLKTTDGNAEATLEAYLTLVFSRFQRFWALAFGITIVGVLHYWLTLWPQYLHLLFIVGLFSLFLNYPRKEFFTEIPYQLQRIKMDMDENL